MQYKVVVEIDGQQQEVLVESETEPTQAQVLAALGSQPPPTEETPVEEPSFAARAGQGVMDLGAKLTGMLPEGIREELQARLNPEDKPREEIIQDIIQAEIPASIQVAGRLPGSSIEQMIDAIPGIAGGVGALAGGLPAIGAGMTGEVTRQKLREFLQQPAATGLIQEVSGMDPDSPEAKITGVLGEGALGASAVAASAMAPTAARAGRRSMQNLVQLPEKIRDRVLRRGGTKGEELLRRMVDEGIAPPGSTRTSQVARAEERLEAAKAESAALWDEIGESGLTDESVDDVLRTLGEQVPPTRPGGPARTSETTLKNANKALSDANDFITGAKAETGYVSAGQARTEKTRIADEIKTLFESGGDTPLQRKALKASGEAWRAAIEKSYPDVAAADLRQSDLITINKYMQKALKKAEFAGADATAEGVAGGAALGNRWSVVYMIAGKAGALATAGPISSLSGAGKRLMASVLSSPSAMQAWVRTMSNLSPSPTELLDENNDIGSGG